MEKQNDFFNLQQWNVKVFSPIIISDANLISCDRILIYLAKFQDMVYNWNFPYREIRTFGAVVIISSSVQINITTWGLVYLIK